MGAGIRLLLAFTAVALSGHDAAAGFGSWGIETEDDPFSKGRRVTVDYVSSMRSGAFVFCDTSSIGLEMRAVPGFTFSPELEGYKSRFKVAIDGELVFEAQSYTHSVGDFLAASSTVFAGEDAKRFVEAMKVARKQIAIDDGISDKPHLLTARGSTKAGAALENCLAMQRR